MLFLYEADLQWKDLRGKQMSQTTSVSLNLALMVPHHNHAVTYWRYQCQLHTFNCSSTHPSVHTGYAWLTKTGRPRCWPWHMPVPGFHFPWLHCPSWRLTSQTRFSPQTVVIVKWKERNKQVSYWGIKCKWICKVTVKRSLLALFELTSVKRVVFCPSMLDKNSWLSARLASVPSVLWGLREKNTLIRT